jgi:hypothetical protein
VTAGVEHVAYASVDVQDRVVRFRADKAPTGIGLAPLSLRASGTVQADGKVVIDADMTSGSAVLTSPSAELHRDGRRQDRRRRRVAGLRAETTLRPALTPRARRRLERG